ncbi:MAG: DUF4230 domain-containing protein [Treponemataceae bacterium]|nr:DUF4230 domain-containing protein [Treponemataceae bacterium]
MEENRPGSKTNKENRLVIIDPMKVHPLHIVAFVETFLLFLVLGFFIGKGTVKQDVPQNSITILQSRISEISELTTLQLDYDALKMLTSAKASWYGIKIPKTEDKIVLGISGTIKFGINLRDVRLFIEEDNMGNIKIKLPKAKILSHELNHENATIESLSDSFFNNMQQSYAAVYTAANDAFLKIKDEKEQSEEVLNALEKATEKAKEELEILLSPLVPKEKSIQFEFIE